jgi:hypothetical protein
MWNANHPLIGFDQEAVSVRNTCRAAFVFCTAAAGNRQELRGAAIAAKARGAAP